MWEELSPPYRTIVADPPWRFRSAATKADAREHYSTMDQQVSPSPYVELFCRQPRFGWDSWGWGYESAGKAVLGA